VPAPSGTAVVTGAAGGLGRLHQWHLFHIEFPRGQIRQPDPREFRIQSPLGLVHREVVLDRVEFEDQCPGDHDVTDVGVNADHAPRHGFELSRSGLNVLAVVPVNGPDGTHAGSVDLGLDVGPMLDDLDESFGLDSTFFVLEAPLREISTHVNPAALADENRVGNYLKWYSTNWALTQALVTASDLGSIEEPVRYTRDVDGVPYGVLLFPVRNIAGEPVGVISVARDFSPTRAAAGRSLVWQSLLALFASVIIAGAVLVIIRGLLLRPLARVSSAMRELASGEAGAPIADTDAMPEELQEIAKHHETMRAKQNVRTLYGPGESS